MTENSAIPLAGEWRAHAADPDLVKTFAAADADDESWPNVRVPHDSHDGSMLYRHRFSHAADYRARAFLEVDDRSDVWLDGEYLGAAEGSFAPSAFEITDVLRARDDHVLALEASGIAAPPRIVETGAVRIEEARVLCVEASVERGRVQCNLALHAGDTPREARLVANVIGPNNGVLLQTARDATLAAGPNELSWPIAVEEPPRWWPRSLGLQPLCLVDVAVEVDGAVSDARRFRIGFREIRADEMRFTVNGEPLFLKGACDDDVDRAVEANLDFLRIVERVAPDDLYDAADEAGMLLMQDYPVRGRNPARRVRSFVARLGHHPSVFAWRAHKHAVARALKRTDSTRSVLTQDTEMKLPDVARAVRLVPRVGRFVSSLPQSQVAIEDLRRLAGTPTGGFAVAGAVDDVVHAACRPVLPMIDPRTGNVHVANDTPARLEDAVIEVTVDGLTRRWRGDVDANTVTFVGRVDVAHAAELDIALAHPRTGRVVNRLRVRRSDTA